MDDEKLMTLEELAARMGCTTQAIRASMRTDNLPGRKVGSRWLFAWSEVVRWVGRGTWQSEKARRQEQDDGADADKDDE